MMYRQLSVPVLVGRNLIVADYQGYVHWLGHDDGALLARTSTDGTAIDVPPLALSEVSSSAVLVQTIDGDLYAFSAE
jgi:outer membrane protein assembly factor BamB